MEKRRAVVTGLGVVSPNGMGTRDFWQATAEGRSGIAPITVFDASIFECRIAGQVNGLDPLQYTDKNTARRVDRFVHLGLAAAHMALADSALALAREDRNRIGCIIGSGLGGILFHEEQMLVAYERGPNRLNPLCVPRISPNAVASHIAIQHGLLGPNMVISTACASSNHAIGESMRKIQYGDSDVIVAGGVEAPLTQFTFGAYCAMKVLSKRNDEPHRASRPFDRDRDGFVLAEGSACLIIEALDHALARGAHIYAELIGYSLSSGAHHMVIPDPSGHDAAVAMALAVKDAAIRPEQVDYINAHGTSTHANDIAETRAIKEVFGAHAYKVAISSTKSVTGHTVGAAGAIEAAACCLAIDQQTIPPTINYENPDPECDLDFGNANACLVFSRYSS